MANFAPAIANAADATLTANSVSVLPGRKRAIATNNTSSSIISVLFLWYLSHLMSRLIVSPCKSYQHILRLHHCLRDHSDHDDRIKLSIDDNFSVRQFVSSSRLKVLFCSRQCESEKTVCSTFGGKHDYLLAPILVSFMFLSTKEISCCGLCACFHVLMHCRC